MLKKINVRWQTVSGLTSPRPPPILSFLIEQLYFRQLILTFLYYRRIKTVIIGGGRGGGSDTLFFSSFSNSVPVAQKQYSLKQRRKEF